MMSLMIAPRLPPGGSCQATVKGGGAGLTGDGWGGKEQGGQEPGVGCQALHGREGRDRGSRKGDQEHSNLEARRASSDPQI